MQFIKKLLIFPLRDNTLCLVLYRNLKTNMMIDSQIKRKLRSLASLSLLVGAVSFSSCSGGSDQKSGISKTNPEDIKVVSEMVAELTRSEERRVGKECRYRWEEDE